MEEKKPINPNKRPLENDPESPSRTGQQPSSNVTGQGAKLPVIQLSPPTKRQCTQPVVLANGTTLYDRLNQTINPFLSGFGDMVRSGTNSIKQHVNSFFNEVTEACMSEFDKPKSLTTVNQKVALKVPANIIVKKEDGTQGKIPATLVVQPPPETGQGVPEVKKKKKKKKNKEPSERDSWLMTKSVAYTYHHPLRDSQKGPEECIVCYHKFKEGEAVRRLICLHLFHTKCIDEWAFKMKTCPACTTSLEGEKVSRLHPKPGRS